MSSSRLVGSSSAMRTRISAPRCHGLQGGSDAGELGLELRHEPSRLIELRLPCRASPLRRRRRPGRRRRRWRWRPSGCGPCARRRRRRPRRGPGASSSRPCSLVVRNSATISASAAPSPSSRLRRNSIWERSSESLRTVAHDATAGSGSSAGWATHRSSTVDTASNRTGLVMKSSIPAAMQRSRSPSIAAAVIAMIGVCRAGALDPPDRRGRLVPVHLGHLAVHEDGVIGARSVRVDGLDPVVGDREAVAEVLEHLRADELVHLVVLHEQDRPAHLRRLGACLLRGDSVASRPRPRIEAGDQAVEELRRADRLREAGGEPGQVRLGRLEAVTGRAQQEQHRLARWRDPPSRCGPVRCRPCRACSGPRRRGRRLGRPGPRSARDRGPGSRRPPRRPRRPTRAAAGGGSAGWWRCRPRPAPAGRRGSGDRRPPRATVRRRIGAATARTRRSSPRPEHS